MARPARNARPENILSSARTFFATTKTSQGLALLQSEPNAALTIDGLRSYVAAGKFLRHDFVIMPDHLHLLLTVGEGMTIERAMQFIKVGFSYRLKREAGYLGEVWQRGFSETRVEDRQSFLRHREYIASNPVKAGLADSFEEYPYCFAYWQRGKQQGLKPRMADIMAARLKPCPDTNHPPQFDRNRWRLTETPVADDNRGLEVRQAEVTRKVSQAGNGLG